MNSDKVLTELKKKIRTDMRYCRRKEKEMLERKQYLEAYKYCLYKEVNKRSLKQIKDVETSQSHSEAKHG